MNWYFIQVLIIFSAIGFDSCKSQKQEVNGGTLSGNLGLLEGDCMPGPERPPCEAVPTSGIIYVTKPSQNYQENLLVGKIEVKQDGLFTIRLEPGKYSLFVQDEEQITCTITSCPDQCYCLLVEIVASAVTHQEVIINHATW